MSDTPREVAQIYRDLLLAESRFERLRAGCEMFETAKAFALAGLRQKSEERLRERLFLRLDNRRSEPDRSGDSGDGKTIKPRGASPTIWQAGARSWRWAGRRISTPP